MGEVEKLLNEDLLVEKEKIEEKHKKKRGRKKKDQDIQVAGQLEVTEAVLNAVGMEKKDKSIALAMVKKLHLPDGVVMVMAGLYFIFKYIVKPFIKKGKENEK